MNKIHKIIWSEIKAKWIVVSEKTGSKGCPVLSLGGLSLAVMMAMSRPAFALDPGSLPTGGQITSGSGTVTVSGNLMTVGQSSQQMIANWNSFNIGAEAGVRFSQPNAQATALNRISDQNPSQILGSLSANGRIFLINPAGIIFGQGSKVDVGGLVASSLNMLDSDFLAGNHRFSGSGGEGSIVNQGAITAMPGGVVALVAPKVQNEGTISTPGGSTALIAGNQVSLDFKGDGLVTYTIDQGALDALAENKGLIKADGGLVVMTAKSADAITRAVVNNSGIIEAQTLEGRSGRILLLSDMAAGKSVVAGRLDASAPDGGDGGFIETSAAGVTVQDGVQITTAAPLGKSGQWLLDPVDITIAASGGSVTGTAIASALATTSVTLDTSGSGSSSGVSPVSFSGSSGNITVNDNINVGSDGADTTLTLKATGSIVQNGGKSITRTGNNKLNVVYWADSDTSNDGYIRIGDGISNTIISTNGGDITLGGGSNPLTGYAQGNAEQVNGVNISGTLNAGGGNISILGKGLSVGVNTYDYTSPSRTAASISTTGSGNITLVGVGSGNGGQDHGIQTFVAVAGSKGTSFSTVNGNISLTGTALSSGSATGWQGRGIDAAYSSFTSTNGNITLNGNAATTGNDAVSLYQASVSITGSGNLALQSLSTGNTLYVNTASIGSGTITLVSDSLAGIGQVGTLSTTNSGNLVIKPLTTGTTIGIAGASGTLQVTATNFSTNFTNGFSSITIGSTNSGLITVGASDTLSYYDPLILKSGGSIFFSTSSAMRGDGSSLTLWSRSGGTDAANDGVRGAVWLPVGSSVNTGGGAVTIGGGTNPATGYALGDSDVSSTENNARYRGVTVNGSITAGGGNISILGKGSPIVISRGISIGGTVSTLGSGSITMNGIANWSSDGLALGDASLGIDGTITAVDGIINLSGTNFVNQKGINLSTASSSINTSGAGNISLVSAGILNGTGYIKAGGTTVLAASERDITATNALNDFTGGVTITGSAVQVVDANALVLAGDSAVSSLTATAGTSISGTGTLSVSSSAIFSVASGSGTYSGVISGAGSVTKSGNGMLTLSGSNTYTGVTTVSAGTLAVGNASGLGSTSAGTTVASSASLDLQNVSVGAESVTLNGGTLKASTGTSSLSGTIALGSTSTVDVGATQLTLSGLISGSGNGLAKSGSGTLTLSGTNTYSGGTTMSAGTLALDSAGAIGSSGTLSFAGGTLQYSGSNSTDYSNRFSTAAGQAYSIDTNGQSVTLASALTSSSGTLTKSGTGTLTLSGTNTYSGATIVNAGTLAVGNAAGLGSTSAGTTVASNASLDLQNVSVGAESVTLNGGTLKASTGTSSLSGAISLGSSSAISVSSGSSLSVTGSVTAAAGRSLSISGGGDLSLGNTANSLAGGVNASSVGNFSLINNGALSVGDISASGTIDMATLTGELTLAGAIRTSSTSSSAIILNAGKSTAAGTATGGNVIVGSGSVSVGTGGTARIYTGGVSGSTGLTTLIGSGSGMFRYNSDESATNYTTALASGVNAIYREQPAVTITANDVSKTYDGKSYSGGGGVIPGGFVNGDTSSSLNGTLAYVGSSQGATNPDRYTITPGGYANGLGYLLSYVNGVLTIGKAHLTVTANDQSRLYGAANPTFTETITGYVNNENATSASVSGTATGSSTATATTGVGTAVITGSTGTLSAANYDFTAADGVLTINKAHLTVTANDQSRLYGAANPTFTETVTGYVNSENATSASVSGTATGSSTATATTGVGTAVITGSTGTLSAANYDFTAANGVLTINKAHLTVTANDQSRLYGAANPTFTETVTGYVNSENATSASVSGTATGSSTATATTGVGTAVITGSTGTLSAANYDFTAADGVLTINKAHLTVTANDQSRLYGAANPTFTETVTGYVNNENATSASVSGTATGSSTATATSGVGTAVITGSTGTLSAANYDFTAADGVLTINKAHLTVTANDQSRLYGAANPTFTETITGYVNSENATSASVSGTATGSSTATATTGVGTAVITGSTGTLSAANYDFTAADGVLTINKAHLTVTANDQSRLYGAANPTFTETITGYVNNENATSASVSGTATGSSTATATTGVGTAVITGSTGTLSAANYDFTAADGVLTINKAHLTVTANDQSRLYGAANPTFTETITGYVNSENATSASVSGTATGSSTATATTGVGTAVITGSTGTLSAANYDFTAADGVLTINKAHLTVTANDQSRLYGAANPTFTETITGYVNNENATSASVSGTATGSSTATATTGVGTAVITGSTGTLSAANYDFTAADGVLTINKAHLTVTANDQSRLYGAANPTFTETVTGYVNNENATSASVSGTATGSSTATATTGVGTAVITGSTGTLSAANYDFTAADGVLTINKAHLTVTANDQSRLYGAANPTFTETITGYVNNENATSASVSGTATGSSTATATTGVGTAVITGSTGTLSAANYDFTAANGVLTINKAHLTVTANDQSRLYGAANPTFTETVTGYVNSENATSASVSGTATGSSTATATTGVGTAVITGSTGTLSAANYDFTAADGVLTINKAHLTVTAADVSKTFGQSLILSAFTSLGLQNGEEIGSVTLICAGLPPAASVAGSPYAIIASAAGGGTFNAGNYDISYRNGILTITAVPETPVEPMILTVTPVQQAVPTTPPTVFARNSGSTTASVSGVPVGTPIATAGGITIQLVSQPTQQAAGLITMKVPEETATRQGPALKFPLPEEVKIATGGTISESVALTDGGPLPGWLRYESETKTFVASNLPKGALPISLVVSVGKQTWIVEISKEE